MKFIDLFPELLEQDVSEIKQSKVYVDVNLANNKVFVELIEDNKQIIRTEMFCGKLPAPPRDGLTEKYLTSLKKKVVKAIKKYFVQKDTYGHLIIVFKKVE